MNKTLCSACNNQVINLGRIPDGILLRCNYCGTKKIFVENFEKIKDEAGYADAYKEKINETKINYLIQIFEKYYSANNSDIELLDIGFGTGEFLIAMKMKGISVFGLECDKKSSEIILDKGIDAFNGELGGRLTIDKKFDVITLWDLIEHVNDVQAAMQQLRDLTKEKGKILLVTPNSESLFDLTAAIERKITFRKSERIMNICLNRYHLHRFSRKGIKILFERFGFKIEEMKLIQLFSLKKDEYTDGFAPGILKWTNSPSFNRIFSKMMMSIIKGLRIRNKIFVVAVKN